MPVGRKCYQKIDIISSKEMETKVTGNDNIPEVLQAKAGSSVGAFRNDASFDPTAV